MPRATQKAHQVLCRAFREYSFVHAVQRKVFVLKMAKDKLSRSFLPKCLYVTSLLKIYNT